MQVVLGLGTACISLILQVCVGPCLNHEALERSHKTGIRFGTVEVPGGLLVNTDHLSCRQGRSSSRLECARIGDEEGCCGA